MKKQKIILIGIFLISLIAVCVASYFIFFAGSEIGDDVGSYNVYFNDDNEVIYIDGEMIETDIEENDDIIELFEELSDVYLIKDVEEEIKLIDSYEYDGITYYKVQQEFDNIEVYGHTLTVSVSDGKVNSITGKVLKDINVFNLDAVTTTVAKWDILEDYSDDAVVEEINKYILDRETIIYSAIVIDNDLIEEVLYDAVNEEIIQVNNLINYANDINVTTTDFYGSEVEISIRENTLVYEDFYDMYDSSRKINIIDASDFGNISGLLFAPDSPILLDYEDGNLSLAYDNLEVPNLLREGVSILNNFAITYDYFYDNFGLKSYDGKSKEIVVKIALSEEVNFFSTAEDYSNASYATIFNEFLIGSKNGVSFGVHLDVVGHEYTHGVIDHSINLKNYPDVNQVNYSSAINEAYADLFGSLIEGKDWIVGNDLELRNLSDPHLTSNPIEINDQFYFPDGIAIDRGLSLEEYMTDRGFENVHSYDEGAVHHNSTVISHSIVRMYEDKVIESKDEMGDLLYKSMNYLSQTPTFEDFAWAFISACRDSGFSEDELETVKSYFYDSGVLKEKNINVNGRVYYDGKTVPGVKINFINANNVVFNYTTYTDNKGTYDFELPYGVYYVTLEHDKYLTKSSIITVNNEKNVFYFDLEKDIIKEEINVAFLIDNSGSMEPCEKAYSSSLFGTSCYDENDSEYLRIDFVREMMNTMENYNVNYKMDSFTKDLYEIVDWTNDYEEAYDAVRKVKTNEFDYNGTVFSPALYDLAMSMDRDEINVITILTDGEETEEDVALSAEVLSEIKNNHVVVNTVCLGNCNYEYLKLIASETNGYYVRVTNNDLLTSFANAVIINSLSN